MAFTGFPNFTPMQQEQNWRYPRQNFPRFVSDPNYRNTYGLGGGGGGGGRSGFSLPSLDMEDIPAPFVDEFSGDRMLRQKMQENAIRGAVHGRKTLESEETPWWAPYALGGMKVASVLDDPRQRLYGLALGGLANAGIPGVSKRIREVAGDEFKGGALDWMRQNVQKGRSLEDTLDASELLTMLGIGRTKNEHTGNPFEADDPLREFGRDAGRFARGVGTFGLNVLTDPTTYLMLGLGGLAKGAGTNLAKTAGTQSAKAAQMGSQAVSRSKDAGKGLLGLLAKGRQAAAEGGNLGDDILRGTENEVARAVFGANQAKSVVGDTVVEGMTSPYLANAATGQIDEGARAAAELFKTNPVAARRMLVEWRKAQRMGWQATNTGDQGFGKAFQGMKPTIDGAFRGSFGDEGFDAMKQLAPREFEKIAGMMGDDIPWNQLDPQTMRLLQDFAMKGQKDFGRVALQVPFASAKYRMDIPYLSRGIANVLPRPVAHSGVMAKALSPFSRYWNDVEQGGTRLYADFARSSRLQAEGASQVAELTANQAQNVMGQVMREHQNKSQGFRRYVPFAGKRYRDRLDRLAGTASAVMKKEKEYLVNPFERPDFYDEVLIPVYANPGTKLANGTEVVEPRMVYRFGNGLYETPDEALADIQSASTTAKRAKVYKDATERTTRQRGSRKPPEEGGGAAAPAATPEPKSPTGGIGARTQSVVDAAENAEKKSALNTAMDSNKAAGGRHRILQAEPEPKELDPGSGFGKRESVWEGKERRSVPRPPGTPRETPVATKPYAGVEVKVRTAEGKSKVGTVEYLADGKVVVKDNKGTVLKRYRKEENFLGSAARVRGEDGKWHQVNKLDTPPKRAAAEPVEDVMEQVADEADEVLESNQAIVNALDGKQRDVAEKLQGAPVQRWASKTPEQHQNIINNVRGRIGEYSRQLDELLADPDTPPDVIATVRAALERENVALETQMDNYINSLSGYKARDVRLTDADYSAWSGPKASRIEITDRNTGEVKKYSLGVRTKNEDGVVKKVFYIQDPDNPRKFLTELGTFPAGKDGKLTGQGQKSAKNAISRLHAQRTGAKMREIGYVRTRAPKYQEIGNGFQLMPSRGKDYEPIVPVAWTLDRRKNGYMLVMDMKGERIDIPVVVDGSSGYGGTFSSLDDFLDSFDEIVSAENSAFKFLNEQELIPDIRDRLRRDFLPRQAFVKDARAGVPINNPATGKPWTGYVVGEAGTQKTLFSNPKSLEGGPRKGALLEDVEVSTYQNAERLDLALVDVFNNKRELSDFFDEFFPGKRVIAGDPETYLSGTPYKSPAAMSEVRPGRAGKKTAGGLVDANDIETRQASQMDVLPQEQGGEASFVSRGGENVNRYMEKGDLAAERATAKQYRDVINKTNREMRDFRKQHAKLVEAGDTRGAAKLARDFDYKFSQGEDAGRVPAFLTQADDNMEALTVEARELRAQLAAATTKRQKDSLTKKIAKNSELRKAARQNKLSQRVLAASDDDFPTNVKGIVGAEASTAGGTQNVDELVRETGSATAFQGNPLTVVDDTGMWGFTPGYSNEYGAHGFFVKPIREVADRATGTKKLVPSQGYMFITGEEFLEYNTKTGTKKFLQRVTGPDGIHPSYLDRQIEAGLFRPSDKKRPPLTPAQRSEIRYAQSLDDMIADRRGTMGISGEVVTQPEPFTGYQNVGPMSSVHTPEGGWKPPTAPTVSRAGWQKVPYRESAAGADAMHRRVMRDAYERAGDEGGVRLQQHYPGHLQPELYGPDRQYQWGMDYNRPYDVGTGAEQPPSQHLGLEMPEGGRGGGFQSPEGVDFESGNFARRMPAPGQRTGGSIPSDSTDFRPPNARTLDTAQEAFQGKLKPIVGFEGDKYVPSWTPEGRVQVTMADVNGVAKDLGEFDTPDMAINFINAITGKSRTEETTSIFTDETLDYTLRNLASKAGWEDLLTNLPELKATVRLLIDLEQDIYKQLGGLEAAAGLPHDMVGHYVPGQMPRTMTKNAQKIIDAATGGATIRDAGDFAAARGSSGDSALRDAMAGSSEARFGMVEGPNYREPGFMKDAPWHGALVERAKETGMPFETSIQSRVGARLGTGIRESAKIEQMDGVASTLGRRAIKVGETQTRKGSQGVFQFEDGTTVLERELSGDLLKMPDGTTVYEFPNATTKKLFNDIITEVDNAKYPKDAFTKLVMPLMTIARPAFTVTNTLGNVDFALRNGHLTPNSLVGAARAIKRFNQSNTMGAKARGFAGAIDMDKSAAKEFAQLDNLVMELSRNGVISPKSSAPIVAEFSQIGKMGQGNIFSKMPVLGRYLDMMQGMNNTSENYFRAAVYINARKMGMGEGAAAQEVNRVMLDYFQSSLTHGERQVRRFVPFYTWSRRNIPASAELFMERPGFAYQTYTNHLPRAFSESREDYDENGVPQDISPDEYMRRWQELPASQRQSTGPGIFGEDSHIRTRLPMNDFGEFLTLIDEATQTASGHDTPDKLFQETLDWGGRQLGPGGKMLAEIFSGADFETGAPLADEALGEGRDVAFWRALGQNVPLIGQGIRAKKNVDLYNESGGSKGDPNAWSRFKANVLAAQAPQQADQQARDVWGRQRTYQDNRELMMLGNRAQESSGMLDVSSVADLDVMLERQLELTPPSDYTNWVQQRMAMYENWQVDAPVEEKVEWMSTLAGGPEEEGGGLWNKLPLYPRGNKHLANSNADQRKREVLSRLGLEIDPEMEAMMRESSQRQAYGGFTNDPNAMAGMNKALMDGLMRAKMLPDSSTKKRARDIEKQILMYKAAQVTPPESIIRQWVEELWASPETKPLTQFSGIPYGTGR